MIVLRPYSARDEIPVLALWWGSWHSIRPGLQHPLTFAAWRTRWLEEILPAQEVVVAEDDSGQLGGFAAAHLQSGELTQIFVAPERKRCGIGRRLLHWAQEQMPAGFRLHTLAENLASRTFYESQGLFQVGRRTSPVNGMATIEYRWMPCSPS